MAFLAHHDASINVPAFLPCHCTERQVGAHSKKGWYGGRRYVPVSRGLSNGAKAGITLAALVGIALLVVLPIVLFKRRKAWRAAEPAEARAALVDAAHDPEVGRNGFH